MEAERKQVFIFQSWSIVGLVLIAFLYNRFTFSIEMIAVLLVILMMWRVNRQTMFVDLLPLFVLFLTFQALPGNAAVLNGFDIHIRDIFQFEEAIFGGVLPSYWLQTNVYPSAFGELTTMIANLFYISHFVTPLVTAVILWSRHKTHYWHFILGLSAVSFIGISIYILFPAAPPWWATENGYLINQPVHLVGGFEILEFMVRNNPNPVAAMPSLHMAFPTFIALFALRVWGPRVRWVVCLPVFVGISAVYLGHHYVVDLVAGGVLSSFVIFGLQLVNWDQTQDRKVLIPFGSKN